MVQTSQATTCYSPQDGRTQLQCRKTKSASSCCVTKGHDGNIVDWQIECRYLSLCDSDCAFHCSRKRCPCFLWDNCCYHQVAGTGDEQWATCAHVWSPSSRQSSIKFVKKQPKSHHCGGPISWQIVAATDNITRQILVFKSFNVFAHRYLVDSDQNPHRRSKEVKIF